MLLVEFVFNLSAEFISTLGNGQFNVFPHALFEVVGLTTELLFNVGLELLGDVFLETQAASLVLHLQAGFALLEALTKLLFKPGSDAATKLFFSFCQKGFMAFFQSAHLQTFHFYKAALHLLFEVGLDVPETLLEGLVVFQTQPFLLDGETTVVLLVELGFNGGLDLRFTLFQALMLLNIVSFLEGLDLAFQSQVKFVADTSLFGCQSVTFHGFQFGFHRSPQLVFKGVEGEFVLGCEVLGDVGLQGVHPFGDRLLTKATFPTEVGPHAFLLAEPGTGAHGLVKRGRVGRGELGTQGRQGYALGCVAAFVRRINSLTVMAFAHTHWNPIHLFMDFSS